MHFSAVLFDAITLGQKLDRRYYELAALWLLRQQLRSGDIYLAQSRRFSELETYFIRPKEWSLCRDEVVTTRVEYAP